MRLLFGPLRPLIANWNEAARAILDRARRETATDRDPARRRLIEECESAAPEEWRAPVADSTPQLVVTVDLSLGDLQLRMFSTIATLGTALDITLQELRIESFHAADEETEKLIRSLSMG